MKWPVPQLLTLLPPSSWQCWGCVSGQAPLVSKWIDSNWHMMNLKFTSTPEGRDSLRLESASDQSCFLWTTVTTNKNLIQYHCLIFPRQNGLKQPRDIYTIVHYSWNVPGKTKERKDINIQHNVIGEVPFNMCSLFAMMKPRNFIICDTRHGETYNTWWSLTSCQWLSCTLSVPTGSQWPWGWLGKPVTLLRTLALCKPAHAGTDTVLNSNGSGDTSQDRRVSVWGAEPMP